MLVATGRAEIMADPAVGALWDYLPMVPIIAEAGGRLSTLGGGAIGAWTSALATNSRLHQAAMDCWPAASLGDGAVQVDAILARQAG
jgi:histidinol-phosphatase